jgi:hypothetical protein
MKNFPPLLFTLILSLLVGILACNLGFPAPATEVPPTLTPTRTPPPAPTQVPSELVWFAPNMGSRDYTDLFTQPEAWASARSHVDVFKFYTHNLDNEPCDICGDNYIQPLVDARAFQRLADWGMGIAIEIGAVKEWGCSGEMEYQTARFVVQNVQRSGGVVGFLAMDEPLIGGEMCRQSMEETAEITGRFVSRLREAYPSIVVGDIEPYPHFSAAELTQWLDLLEGNNATPVFFHLDVDIERVYVERKNVAADLQTLRQFSEARGIRFGVIFTSNWTRAGTDQGYYQSTLQWIRTVGDAIGRPQHLIFQSWQGPAPSGFHEVPINLPENDPGIFSHTRLVLEGLGVFNR